MFRSWFVRDLAKRKKLKLIELNFERLPNLADLFSENNPEERLGEIDYIIQHGNRVVPVKVKSGSAGSMKSLHQFMAEKRLDFAVRCNTNQVSLENIRVKTTMGKPVSYRLLSIPVYLTERLNGLIEQADHQIS